VAKRFTDTNKYKKPFIRGLQGPYKVLWDFIYHDCDHAGIWIVDFDIAQIYVGMDMPVNKKDALKYFNESKKRIIEVDEGERWFIPSFIEIQYGKLSPDNRAHLSAIKILDKYKLLDKNKGLISSLQRAKDKYKDKDMVKDKIKESLNFYSEQIKSINENESLKERYITLVSYLFGENALNCPVEYILKLQNQLTFIEYKKLFKKAHAKNLLISELLDSWLNNPSYSKGKVSVYLNLNNWINRNDGKRLTPSTEKKWDETPKTGETLSLLEIINKMSKKKG